MRHQKLRITGFACCGLLRIASFAVAFACGFIVRADAATIQTGNPIAVIRPPRGYVTSGPAEIFVPNALYEKINGQAELYLSAGFVSLTSQWYEAVDAVDSLLEVNIYHMGSFLNAFSVYSLQRRENAAPIDLARFAYQTENAVYLVHGVYYVEILSTTSAGGPKAAMKLMAQEFMRNTPANAAGLTEIERFPQSFLVENSISVIASDAFGFEKLDRVFTASYALDGNRATAFLSKRKTPKEAEGLVRGLHTYFKDFGGRDLRTDLSVKGVRLIEIVGMYALIFSVNDYLAGVYEASSRQQAETVARMLLRSLQTADSNQ